MAVVELECQAYRIGPLREPKMMETSVYGLSIDRAVPSQTEMASRFVGAKGRDGVVVVEAKYLNSIYDIADVYHEWKEWRSHP